MKKPLIGPKSTGLVDIIKHKKTELLFANNNADELAQALNWYFDHPKQMRQRGQQLYRYVKQHFSMKQSLLALRSCYDDVLANRSL